MKHEWTYYKFWKQHLDDMRPDKLLIKEELAWYKH